MKNDLTYVDQNKRSIFFLDENIETLKKWGNLLVEDYPEFEVIAFDSWKELKEEMERTKPHLLILEINKDGKEFIDFVENLRKQPLFKNSQIIALGPRAFVEEHFSFLDNKGCQFIPKPIRQDTFRNTVQGAMAQASAISFQSAILKKGDVLFREGDLAEDLYILKKGKLSVYKENDGDLFILGEVNEDEVVGEMALVLETTRSASVKAELDSEVISFKVEGFREYLKSQPFWFSRVLETLIKRVKKV